MILLAIGSNLSHPRYGPPLTVCEAALVALAEEGIAVLGKSPWYETAPVPASDQPWFVNGVAQIGTNLEPPALLARLHRLESAFGRRRNVPNEARVLDLDLLAYERQISDTPPVLPHPRMHERAFVMIPLADLAPNWRHPLLGRSARDFARDLAELGGLRPIGSVHGHDFSGNG